MKTLHLILSLALTVSLLVPTTLRASVEEDLKSTAEADQSTLVSPLLLSQPSEHFQVPDGTSLLKNPFEVGYEGDLQYEKLSDETFRLRYFDLTRDASFFFVFDKPLNLKDRWVRLRYTGLKLPSHLALELDFEERRSDTHYDLYLDQAPGLGSVYFKLPAKASFEQVDSLRLIMEPDHLASMDADFMILGLEIVPEGEGPLDNLGPSDYRHFEELSANSFDAENQVPLNMAYSY